MPHGQQAMTAPGCVARMAAGMIRVYQITLSRLKPPCCRFQPSCSEYAREAVLCHGVLRGAGLAAWRLLRCHPFYRGPVYDPVPGAHDPVPGAAERTPLPGRTGPRPAACGVSRQHRTEPLPHNGNRPPHEV